MLLASHQTIEEYADDVGALWTQQSIPVLSSPPSPLQFLRDCVAPSRPCIIRNAIQSDDGASYLIDLAQIVERHPELNLVVDVTPDGHGDCLRRVENRLVFVTPEEQTMTVKEFQLILSRKSNSAAQDHHRKRIFQDRLDTNGQKALETRSYKRQTTDESVLYYSRQNDNLRKELSNLWSTLNCPRSLDWAEAAFGTGPPDAINLWIGNERAVSSMHKDHYENLFYVLSGQKIFTICPPADAPFLYEQEYESGKFDSTSGTWKVNTKGCTESKVRWIAADVTLKNDAEHISQFPLLQYTHPIEVVVNAGEMLYIPSLWFHRVTQSCETIGLNYWYDMKFDSPLWCYFHFLEGLKPHS
jgi:jumonji domain-containing protein 7